MKRFIFIFATMIMLAIPTLVNAQCVQQNQMSQERIKCYQVELQKAFDQQRAGRNTFLIGAGVQAVGASMVTAAAQTENDLTMLWGGMLTVGGTVTELIGLCKWLKAYDKTRTLKLGYVAESGGIGAVLVF